MRRPKAINYYLPEQSKIRKNGNKGNKNKMKYKRKERI